MATDSGCVGDRVPRAGRRLSRRRPLAWRAWLPAALVGLLVGVEAAAWCGATATVVLCAVVLAAPTALLADRRTGTAILLAAVVSVLGAARTRSDEREGRDRGAVPRVRVPCPLVARIESVHTGVGREGRGARLELRVLAATRREGPQPSDGLRLVLGVYDRPWEIGDEVALRIVPRRARGFCNGGVDRWARWLDRRGIGWTAWARDGAILRRREPRGGWLSGSLVRARGTVGREIDRAVRDPAAAVLRALVIGDKGRLPPELRETFARTGTSHLLAVSGMHLALVAAGASWLARWGLGAVLAPWFGVRPLAVVEAPVVLLAAWGYSSLTGGSVATLRALAMAACFVGGRMSGRPASVWAALGVAATALLTGDPGVRLDPSFQLSFVSVVAIVLAVERTRGRPSAPVGDGGLSGWRRAWAWSVRAVSISTAVTLGTAPLAALHFGRVSLVGVVANLLLAPLLGMAALGLGLLGAAVALTAPALAAAPFVVAGVAVDAAVGFAGVAARWPWAVLSVTRPGELTALAAAATVGALAVGRRRPHAGAAMGVAAVLAAWLAVSDRSDGVRLSILDVGQGDASILESASGDAWVVDGGGLGGDFDTGAAVVVPALTRRRPRRLRAAVLSHADRDHYGGLRAVVDDGAPDELWWNGRGSDAFGFRQLLAAAESRRVPFRRLMAGDRPWRGRDGLEVTVLHPSADPASYSANDASLVLSARYGATGIVFAGDVETRGEAELLSHGWPGGATVLKVAHHGSRTSSTSPFVDAARPALAVASLGLFNRFGFPAPAVVDRYRASGSRWRTTASRGEIVVESDGQLERVAFCRGSDGRPSAFVR